MVTVNVAHTAPVNPASTTSKLSISQLWVALERKARKAEDFVDAIAKTELLEEPRESFVKRKVVFRPHPGMPDSVVEDVTLYKPSRVEFRQDTGTVVNNVLSDGADGGIFLTYSFEWVHPELDAGNPEVESKREGYRKMAKVAVEETIDVARKLAANGELGA